MINKEQLQKKVHILEQAEAAGQTVQLVGVNPGYDDEISLLDLWLVLVKRKSILLGIVLAFLAAGITFAMMKPVSYQYSAVLQIGLMASGDGDSAKLIFIESPGNVLEKLSKSYIPLAVSNYLNQHPELQSIPNFTAKMAKKSDLIAIETRGIEKQSAMYLEIINSIVGYIQKDHQPQIDITRSEYELSLQKEMMIMSVLKDPLTLKLKKKKLESDLLRSSIQMKNLKDSRLVQVLKQDLVMQRKGHTNKLASLTDNYKRLSSELGRLSKVDSLLEKRISELTNTINNELKNRDFTARSISTGPEAMTVLLLDNQIQTNRNQLASLEERLNIKQQKLREKLDNQIKENIRLQDYHQKLAEDISNKLQKMDIDNSQLQQKTAVKLSGLQLGLDKLQLEHKNSILMQQQKIDEIAIRLKGLRDTQTLTAPMQSLKSVGAGKILIVIISLFAGLFVGIFSVFFLEFLSKAKEKTDGSKA
jgi:Chain length determinant protein